MKVISLGLPKCGSMSLTASLNAAGYKAIHWRTDTQPHRYVGTEMLRALQMNRGVFSLFHGYDAVTQMDVCLADSRTCIFPQIELFELIYRQCPTAKFLLPWRNINDHIQSIKDWNDGDYAKRLRTIGGITNLKGLIIDYYTRIQWFMEGKKNFLMFELNSFDVDQRLSDFLGRPIHLVHINRDQHAHA